jgi:hypothetical protein
MWFYSLLYKSIYTSLYKFIQNKNKQIHITSSIHRSSFQFRHHHLFILLYIILNVSLTTATYYDILPLSSLLSVPSLIGLSGIYTTINTTPVFDHNDYQRSLLASQNSILPSIDSHLPDLSDNSSKLAYLNAWQSTQNANLKMMNFSPGGIAICMDTGASSCISNNKSDFIDIQPSSNTVLKGIGSGLHIEGIGTICWKISNDNGDEIALHIHDSLSFQPHLCAYSVLKL